MARLKRDDNFIPVSGGVSSSDSSVVLPLKIDSTTGRLLVSSVGSATEYTEGDTDTTFTGIISLGEYNDTAKPLQLDSNGYLKVNVVAGSASSEQYADGTAVNASYKGNLVLGTDGSNYQILAVDSDGHLQVDVLSGGGGGTEYTEGDTDTTITGKAILWEDTSDTLRTVSASTPLPVDIKNSSIAVTDNGGSLTVDGSVSISGNVNIGDISAGTQTNDVKVTLDGEAVKLTSPTDGTYIGDIKFGESLPAGTNNIGDVDIASAIPVGDNTIGRVKITDGTEVASVNASNQLEVAVGNTVSIQDGGNVISIDDGGGSITVDGSVTVSATDLDIRNLAATQDTITAKLATDAIQNGTTALTPKFAKIDVASSGDNTIVSAVTGKKIRVLQYSLVCGAETTVQWKSSGGTTLSGDMQFAANGGISCPFSPVGLFETASGEGLVLNLSAANAVSGHLCYIEI